MSTNPAIPEPTGPGADRAQPGDVLGIERDGKRSELGDTKQDERERLKDAEEDARDRARERRTPEPRP